MSSTESEIVALAEACREAAWLRNLVEFLDAKQTSPTVIFEDNQSCISSHRNGGCSNRTKHIDIRHYYGRELEQKGVVKIKYCATELNQADILTKPTEAVKLRTISESIRLKKWP